MSAIDKFLSISKKTVFTKKPKNDPISVRHASLDLLPDPRIFLRGYNNTVCAISLILDTEIHHQCARTWSESEN